jgi:formamidopyrimidine-DNA glycosylase
MPELPEVETVRRELSDLIAGHRVATVEMLGARTFRRVTDRDGFTSALIDSTVSAVNRHGKYLLLEITAPTQGMSQGLSRELVIHLRMSGQLLWMPTDSPRPLHTHAVLTFAAMAGELRFVDPRTFGEWFLTVDRAELAHLGPDALALSESDPVEFGRIVGSTRMAIKPLLLDQRRMAGIGNIYADEICFAAGVRIDRPGNSLSGPARRRLAVATGEILRAAVELGGTTLSDAQYVDLYGNAGTAAGSHAVHAKAGQPCRRCGGEILRTVIGGRSAYWCRGCQK